MTGEVLDFLQGVKKLWLPRVGFERTSMAEQLLLAMHQLKWKVWEALDM